jgi:23S rRNA (adenine1618-N6)-methyltransferase
LKKNYANHLSDIDDLSLTYANRNISDNNVADRIRLHKLTSNSPLIPLSTLGISNLSFTMCNPPFYTSHSELLSSAAQKSRPPNSACTGTATEMVTPGGEVAFVSRMIGESLLLRERVQWYSSMLGKLSSVSIIVEKLRNAGIGNYAVTEFVQGSKTRRWAMAWSFGDLRPRMGVARGVTGGGIPKHLLPFPGEYVVSVSGHTIDLLERNLNAALEALPLQWRWKAGISTGVGFAARNVWSRSARRKSARNSETLEEDEDEEEDEMAFGFKISIEEVNGESLKQEGARLVIRWLKGVDSALFESFCGMVKRKLEE